MPGAQQPGGVGERQLVGAHLGQHPVEHLHPQERCLDVEVVEADADLGDVGPGEERGMHGVELVLLVVDDEGLRGGVEHVGRIAEARGEIGAAHVAEAVVPVGDAGVERGLRLQGQHLGAGGSHRVGGGGIAGGARAVEQDLFELLEEAVVDQAVEEADDLPVAEPGVAVGDERELRPAQCVRHFPADRVGGVGALADGVVAFETDQQDGFLLDEDGGVAGAQPLGEAVIAGDVVHPLGPVGPCQAAEIGFCRVGPVLHPARSFDT